MFLRHRLGSVLLAVAVLAGVLVVLPVVANPDPPEAAAVDESSPVTAPFVCDGEGLVSGFRQSTGTGAWRYRRVWVPSGATLSASYSGTVSYQYGPGTAHRASGNLYLNLREVSNALIDDWVKGFSSYPGSPTPTPWPPPFAFSGSTGWWTNAGAARVVVLEYVEDLNHGSDLSWSHQVTITGGNGSDGVECADLEASQFFGGRNAAYKHCDCEDEVAVARFQKDDPVDVHSGNLHFPLPGVGVSGRGSGLGWSLDYNSLGADADVGVGSGWSHSYGMRLDEQPDATMLVHQENGATVRFWPDGTDWVAHSRATASLVENLDGSFTFTRQHTEVFDFDEDGRLTGISDLFGNTTELSYDGDELEWVDDPAGRRLEFSWDDGRIVGVSAPGVDAFTPRTVALDYDGNGDLVTYTDASGGVWSFTYDDHRMETIRKPANHGGAGGAVVENSYDVEGRVVWQDDESDARTVFEYDTPGLGQSTVTDRAGREVIHSYTNGVRTAVTVAPGTAAEATWEFDYDFDTLALLSVEDPNGHETIHDYDAESNRIKTTDDQGVVFEAEFGPLDLPVWTEDGEGVRSEFDWDAGNGNLEAVRVNAGELDERETLYSYADGSHPEDVTAITDPEGKVWAYVYDPDTGDRTSETDPEGNETSFVFNDAGWLTSVVSPRGNAGTPADHTTLFGHDTAGRTVAVTDPEGGVTERFFDAAGRLVWEENASNDRSTFTYDVTGRVESVERPDESVVGFEYWPDGALKTRVDAAEGETGYSYDDAGRLETTTDPLERTTTFGYDAEGRRMWVESPGGDCDASPAERCVVFSYDDRDQVTGIAYSDDDGVTTPDVTGITYDDVGRRTAMVDGTGSSGWEWNAFGELVEYTAGNGDVVAYGYDGRGLQTEVTYPGNKTITRDFDDAGRWVGLGDWLGGDATFGWDENSNLTGITYPSATGNVDVFSFDDADRLSGISYSQDATPFGSISYVRDDDGRVTAADRTGLAGVDETFGYSPLDQLDAVNANALAYDTADNLVTRQDGATQAFDAGNQLCWASPGGGSGSCGSAPGDATAFGYDGLGRRVSSTPADSGVASTYTYDSADRLVAARVPTGEGSQGQFHALASTRVYDSRTACGSPPCGRKTANSVFGVQIAGVGGVPASGVAAVVVNVTVVEPAAGGYVRLFESGESAPSTSNVNHGVNQIISNAATVPVGSDGKIAVLPSAMTHVLVDVQGWYSAAGEADAGSVFESVSPARIVDTRSGTSTGSCFAPNGTPTACATLGAGGTLTFAVTGAGGVAVSGVEAVVVNVTVINPAAPGVLGVYPAGGSVPSGSNLNHVGGDVLAQMVVAKVGANGRVSIGSVAATDVIVDVQGYFTTAGLDGGSGFHSTAPVRLFDTRYGSGAGACTSGSCDNLSTGESITFSLNGAGGAPASGIDAVVVSVTAVNTSTGGMAHLRVHEAGVSVPGANSLSYQNAEIVANAVTTRVNAAGEFAIRNDGGTTDVIVDLQGWYSATTREWVYGYDGDGYRATRTSPDEIDTDFTWDHSSGVPRLLSESTGGARTYLVYGPGGHPYAQITGTDVVYYHRDQLGSTTVLTDGDGDPVATYAYDPHGAPAASAGTVTPLLGFAGEYTDTETGLVYLRARYYDPTTGQFLTRDPLEHETHDPYGYANNNPTTYTDPLGLWGWSSVVKVAAAVAVGVTVAVVVAATAPVSVVAIAGGAAIVGVSSGAVAGVVAGTAAGAATYLALDGIHMAKASNKSGKEKANRIPNWVDKADARRRPGENPSEVAERIMKEKYGPDCEYNTGSGSEFSKIKKYASRNRRT